MYGVEKKAWNWKKYVAQHVKYHNILGLLMEERHQDLYPVSKVQYLLNGIRSDKLSTAVAAVKAHPDKYDKDFKAVVTFLSISRESTNIEHQCCLHQSEQTC